MVCDRAVSLWVPSAAFLQPEAASCAALSEVSWLHLLGSTEMGGGKVGGGGSLTSAALFLSQYVQATPAGMSLLPLDDLPPLLLQLLEPAGYRKVNGGKLTLL